MIDELTTLLDSLLNRQRAAWTDGRRVEVDDLLRGTPLESDPEALLDLIYNEIVVREELGEEVDTDTYLERYPALRGELEIHFEIHRALRDPSLIDTDDKGGDGSWPAAGDQDHIAAPEPPGYEVGPRLGEGGMAVVYRALHQKLKRPVALKLFRSGPGLSARELARIRTEAEAMARLSHPNITQIFEIGTYRDAPFLVLELADGHTLADRLKRSPLDPAAAARLVETLADAVEHAHGRHVLHRDIKPANVLFVANGTPKLTDFGLAKLTFDASVTSSTATVTGETLGTPRYMAPEQADGRAHSVGPAADIHALGTLLYECLTGRAPFLSSSVVETLAMIRNVDPLPPRKLQGAVPRDLEIICLRCLEKDPRKRYASAGELVADLARFRRREPIHARPRSIWTQGWRWCRRNPRVAAATALLTLGLGVILSMAAVANHRNEQRLVGLRQEVSNSIAAGKQALDQGEPDLAESRFRVAWRIVEAEPALDDHSTGVAGWLDHAREASRRSIWRLRAPPRDYDARRDEALLATLLVMPHVDNPVSAARDALREARELTVAGDPAWDSERLFLDLADIDMVAEEAGPAAALAVLETRTDEPSRSALLLRSSLLERLGRHDDATRTRQSAEDLPPHRSLERIRHAMGLIRKQRYRSALAEFEQLLDENPEDFFARLCESLCFIKLGRFPEAKVALTACVAQRPRFHWGLFWKGFVAERQRTPHAAREWLVRAIEGHSSELACYAALVELAGLEMESARFDEAIAALTRAVSLRPKDSAGWAWLGTAHFADGNFDEAMHAWRQMLRLVNARTPRILWLATRRSATGLLASRLRPLLPRFVPELDERSVRPNEAETSR